MEKLALVLPETPPYVPRQFGRCAVIGNSEDLLKTRFGKEIDGYDAVVRENGAPIQVSFPLLRYFLLFCFFLNYLNFFLPSCFIKLYLCTFICFLVLQNHTEYVGRKSTFRLLNRGSAKALDKVADLDETGKEVLVVKTTIHDIMNKMIRFQYWVYDNPVYLMLGASFGSSAKGTGLKALEFALSICDSVDMYGFTVDPGYKEW
ncbi:hypothetical protein NE237_032231 [Protea cynaroides]|uniref:Uncharacterized protein n=1 Tax=Protea cynaroides TaxID=273540 RepID=A0A9Q0L2X3_9MAGN|nr:hypothetical protein NE237_032231 [Protea cynaroides]